MPSYREILDGYKKLQLEDGQFKDLTLPQYSQEMNRVSGSNDFDEGMNDGMLRRASVGLDKALEWTHAPQAAESFGRAISSPLPQEYQDVVGQTFHGLPRMGAEILGGLGAAALVPEAVLPAAAASLLGIGGATAVSRYGETGSLGQGLLAGATTVGGMKAMDIAGQAGLRALGGKTLGELAPNIAPFAKSMVGEEGMGELGDALGRYHTAGNLAQRGAQFLGGALAGQGGMFAVNQAAEMAQRAYNGESILPSGTDLLKGAVSQLPFLAYDIVAPHVGLGHPTPEKVADSLVRASEAKFGQDWSQTIEEGSGFAPPKWLTNDRVAEARERVKQHLLADPDSPFFDKASLYESRDARTDEERVADIIGQKRLGTGAKSMSYWDAVQSLGDMMKSEDKTFQATPEQFTLRLLQAQEQAANKGERPSPAELVAQAVTNMQTNVELTAGLRARFDPNYAITLQQEAMFSAKALDDKLADQQLVELTKTNPQIEQLLSLVSGSRQQQIEAGVPEGGQTKQSLIDTSRGRIQQPNHPTTDEPQPPTPGGPRMVEQDAAAQRAVVRYLVKDDGTPTGRSVDLENPESVAQFKGYVNKAVKTAELLAERKRDSEPFLKDETGKPREFASESEATMAALAEETGEGTGQTSFKAVRGESGTWRVKHLRRFSTLSRDQMEAQGVQEGELAFGGLTDEEAIKQELPGEWSSAGSLVAEKVQDQIARIEVGEGSPGRKQGLKDLITTNFMDLLEKTDPSELHRILGKRTTTPWLKTFKGRLIRYLQFLQTPEGAAFRLSRLKREGREEVLVTRDKQAALDAVKANPSSSMEESGPRVVPHAGGLEQDVTQLTEGDYPPGSGLPSAQRLSDKTLNLQSEGTVYRVFKPGKSKPNRLEFQPPKGWQPGEPTLMDKLNYAFGEHGFKNDPMTLANSHDATHGTLAHVSGVRLNLFEQMELVLSQLSKNFADPRNFAKRPEVLKGFFPRSLQSDEAREGLGLKKLSKEEKQFYYGDEGYLANKRIDVRQSAPWYASGDAVETNRKLRREKHSFVWRGKDGSVQRFTGVSNAATSFEMLKAVRDGEGTVGAKQFVRQFLSDFLGKKNEDGTSVLDKETELALRVLTNQDNNRAGYLDIPMSTAVGKNIAADEPTMGVYDQVEGNVGGIMMTAYRVNPKGQVTLRPPGEFAQHLVHELGHGAANWLLHTDEVFKGRVQQVMAYVKQWVADSNKQNALKRQYGETVPDDIVIPPSLRSLSEDDPHEFMAEFMMSGHPLKALLAKVQDNPDLLGVIKTPYSGNIFGRLWSYLRDGFRKLYGASGDTVADRMMGMMEESVARQDAAEGRRALPERLFEDVRKALFEPEKDYVQTSEPLPTEKGEGLGKILGEQPPRGAVSPQEEGYSIMLGEWQKRKDAFERNEAVTAKREKGYVAKTFDEPKPSALAPFRLSREDEARDTAQRLEDLKRRTVEARGERYKYEAPTRSTDIKGLGKTKEDVDKDKALPDTRQAVDLPDDIIATEKGKIAVKTTDPEVFRTLAKLGYKVLGPYEFKNEGGWVELQRPSDIVTSELKFQEEADSSPEDRRGKKKVKGAAPRQQVVDFFKSKGDVVEESPGVFVNKPREGVRPKGELFESRAQAIPHANIINALRWSADEVSPDEDGGVTFKPLRGLSLKGAGLGSKVGKDLWHLTAQDLDSLAEEVGTKNAESVAETMMRMAPLATTIYPETRNILLRNGMTQKSADLGAGMAVRQALMFRNVEDTVATGQEVGGGTAWIKAKALSIGPSADRRQLANAVGHEVFHMAAQGPFGGIMQTLFADLGTDERAAVLQAAYKFSNFVREDSNLTNALTKPEEFWAEIAARLGSSLTGKEGAPPQAIREFFIFGSQKSSEFLRQGVRDYYSALRAFEEAAGKGTGGTIFQTVLDHLQPYIKTIQEIERQEALAHEMRNIFPDVTKQVIQDVQGEALSRINATWTPEQIAPHSPSATLFESRTVNKTSDEILEQLGLKRTDDPRAAEPQALARTFANFNIMADSFPNLRPTVDVLMSATAAAQRRSGEIASLELGSYDKGTFVKDKNKIKGIVKVRKSKEMDKAVTAIGLEWNELFTKAQKDGAVLPPMTDRQFDQFLDRYDMKGEDRQLVKSKLRTMWQQNDLQGVQISESMRHLVQIRSAQAAQRWSGRAISEEQGKQFGDLMVQKYDAREQGQDPAVSQQIAQQAMKILNIDPENIGGAAGVIGRVFDLLDALRTSEDILHANRGKWLSERRMGDFGAWYRNKESGKIESHYFRTEADRDKFLSNKLVVDGPPIKLINNDASGRGFGIDQGLLEAASNSRARSLQKLESKWGKDFADMVADDFDLVSDIRNEMAAKDLASPLARRTFAFGRKYLNLQDVHADNIIATNNAIKNRFVKLETEYRLEQSVFDTQPVLKDHIKGQVAAWLKPDTRAGRFISMANFVSFMGMNLGTMIMEPFQQIMSVAPTLTKNGASLSDSYRYIGAATRDWANSLGGRGLKNVDEQRAMEQWRRDGQSNHWLQQEIQADEDLSQLQARHAVGGNDNFGLFDMLKNKVYNVTKQMQRFYGLAPSANSEIALLAGYKFLREKGVDHDAAVKQSAYMKDVSLFTGGKAQRPGAFHSLPRTVAQTMNSLQSYTNGMMTLMAYLVKDSFVKRGLSSAQQHQVRLATAQMLGTQFLLGGALGMPFVAGGLATLQKLFPEINFEQSARDFLTNFDKHDDGSTGIFGQMATLGIPSLTSAGPDFSSRFALGGTLGVSPYNGVDASAVFGPTGSLVGNIMSSIKDAAGGNAPKAVEDIMPTGFKNMWRAMSEGKAAYDGRGRQLVNDLSAPEIIGKGAGFSPNRVTALRTSSRLEATNERAIREQGRNRDEKMANAFQKGDVGQVSALMNNAIEESGGVLTPLSIGNALAKRIEEKTMPLDPRLGGTKLSASQQADAVRLLGHRVEGLPTMVDREMLRQQVLARLGIPANNRFREASGEDSLMSAGAASVQSQAQQLLSHARGRGGQVLPSMPGE